MSPQVRIAALFLTGALTAAAQETADGQLPVYVDHEVSSEVVQATERAAKAGRWGEVLARYHRLLEENADRMVPLDEKGRSYRGVSHFVFEKMSAMPPEGIAEYRKAYDAYARSLYEDALKNGDEAGMTRVATRWFFSGPGEAASLWVAARLEDRGLLADAASCYGRVVRAYPREGVAPAWVCARWALACRRAGDARGWDLARTELLRFPDAPVSFQGRTLKASEVAALIEAVGATAPADSGGAWWPRLGGNNSATRRVTGSATNDVRLWQFPPRTTAEARDHRKQLESRRWPGMRIKVPFVHAHPAVSRDGTVVYSDGRTVYFLELSTGNLLGTTDREARPEELFRQTLADNPQVISLVTPLLHDGVAYVNRLPVSVRQGIQEPKATAIVAHSIATFTQLWSTSREPALDDVWFGSPPVLHNGRLYAAVTASSVGDRTIELVVLDARTGRLLERRYLCSGSGPVGGWGNNFFVTEAPMIAESGGVLYVSTNLGAVAAIRSTSLDVLWLTVYAPPRPPGRFPGRQQLTQRTGRGLSPIVIDGDRMCVLPGDGDTYYEFDVRTGEALLAVPLKSSPMDPILHFAGIIRPELPPGKNGAPQEPHVLAFFSSGTGASFLQMKESERNMAMPRPLYVLTPPEGDRTGPARGNETNASLVGRMVVTPRALYMPYRGGLTSVSATMKLLGTDGWEKDMSEVDAGHLMVLGDYTLTYSDLGVTCFITRRDFDTRFEKVLAADSRDWAELEKHAEVLIRNPRTWGGAILDYERLAAQSDDPARAVRAHQKLAWIWKMTGDNLLASSPPDFRGAVAAYRKAIAAAPTDEALGDLFRLVGDCHKKLQEWPEAIAVYQEALERYGDRVVKGANGLTRTVREFASAEIAGIISEQGAEAYREVEERAKRLLEDLKAKEGLEDLKRWLDMFQSSSVAPAAAEVLAERLEADGRPWEAVALLRRLADRAAGRPGSAQAVALTAGVLLRLGERESVELQALRLERRHDKDQVSWQGSVMTGLEAAAAIRRALGAAPADTERVEPALAAVWRVRENDQDRVDPAGMGLLPGPNLVVPRGAWAGIDPGAVVFLQRLSTIEARDVVQDRSLWTSTDPRGWLGITWAKAGGDETDISAVVEGGPAANAGLLAGDRPTAWNGVALQNQDHFKRFICAAAGKTVELQVVRTVGGEIRRVTVTVTVGRRDADNPYNEPVMELVFSDGRLLIVRQTTIEAVNPATGESLWLHAPTPSGGTQILNTASADGRIFTAWGSPQPAGKGRPSPPDSQVSMEGISVAHGRLLWALSGQPAATGRLFAAAGTGLVVRCSRRQATTVLSFHNAETGEPAQDASAGEISVETSASGQELAAALDGTRLLWLSDMNTLMSRDLMSGEQRVRDLGGVNQRPLAFSARDGVVALAYTGPDRLIVLPVDPASPRLNAALPEGRLDTAGLHLLDAGRLLVVTVPARPADLPERILRRYEISTGGLRESWKRNLGRAKGASDCLTGFGDHLVTWTEEEGGALGVRWMKEANIRTRWELRVEREPEPDQVVRVGVQGRIVWAQFAKKVVVWR